MPRHVVGDAREWINDFFIVFIYYLAEPQPRARPRDNQQRKKTLLSLTPIRL